MNNVAEYSLSKVNLEEKNVAFVVVPNSSKSRNNKEDSDKAIGMYIPKLMSEIDMGSSAWTRPRGVSSAMIKNSNIKVHFSPVVEHRNFYNVKPLRISNTEQPALYFGEHCWVKFLDGDIKKAVYEPRYMDETKRPHDRHRIFIKDKMTVDSEDKEYEILMDSEEQVIRLFMDNGRDEISQYTIEINGKKGNITMKDKEGNAFVLDTTSSQVKLQTAGGAEFKLSGGTVNVEAPNGFFINGTQLGFTGGDTNDQQ
jgi:hypothetical protein